MRKTAELLETKSRFQTSELHELFLEELGAVHHAERQLTKAFPVLAKAAHSAELREAFESHLKETEEHARRLEEVAKSFGATIKPAQCRAMATLIEEGKQIIDEREESRALDAALIMAAQRMEHYEIASYGVLIAWAQKMGYDKAVILLEDTLVEEKEADERLTQIAEDWANDRADQC